MKKIVFFLLGIFLLSSCSIAEQFVEPEQIQPETGNGGPIIFKQDFMHNLEVKDSVNFFNSEKIVLERNFHLKTYFVKNGIRHNVDTFLFVKKIILPLTCGRVIKINRDQWEEITSIVVSFSEKETSYNLTFFCIDKKNWFILSGGGAQYNFRGQDYPLTVSTKGSCILMVIPPDMSTIYTESFSIFKGWRKR